MSTAWDLRIIGGGVQFNTHWVLRNVTVNLPGGSRTGIIGRSGIGKTSLVRVMAGLAALAEGEATFGADRIRGPGQGVALVFQNGHCFPWLTALENVKFAIGNRHSEPKRGNAGTAEAMELLHQVGLGYCVRMRPHELSGGMSQRLALARALGSRPSVLILDEAFSALDPFTRAEVRNVVRTVCDRAGMTLCVVSHDLEDVISLCERVIVLSGTPAEATEVRIEPGMGSGRLRKEYFRIEGGRAAKGRPIIQDAPFDRLEGVSSEIRDVD